MLLDEWNPKNDAAVLPNSSRAFNGMRYKARRFKFTDEVVAALARLIRDFPNALLENYQFALPPYECCYLEYNLKLFLKELGAKTTGDLPEYAGTVGDETLGVLINHGQVNCIVQGDKGGPPLVTAMCYTMQDHHPPRGFIPVKISRDGAPASDDVVRDHLLGQLLGSTLINPRASLTPERADDLTWRFRIWIDSVVTNHRPKVAISMVHGAMGEMRNMLALLLWLAQPKVAHVVDVPASRGWFGGKPIAYAAHHIVKLRKEVTQRSIVKAFAPRRAPRRHEVEGFWRNYEKTPGCIHDWPILPDEEGHWHCQKCPQWRTRVRQHERGDATVGFVTKEYTT